MPSNFKNLSIIWYDHTTNYITNQEIKDDVVGLPLFTDNGSGEINSLMIDIRAPYGRRITTTFPITIDEFDRIGITMDDRDGNPYTRFYEIQKIIPGTDKDEGTILTLNCLGIEYHTQMGHFSRQFWFTTAFLPSKLIGETYNDNRGTTQPFLSGHNVVYDPDTETGNDLPNFTQGIYDYGINPAYFYDIWMDLVDRQGASGAGGGVFDFFELGFNTPDVNSINMRLFSSGSSPESKTGNPEPVTIETNNFINPTETEGDLENQTGTISYVVGDSRAGALQKGREVYNSGIFQFTFRPEWDIGIKYITDAKVLYQGQHYKSLVDNNLGNTPPGTTSCVADVDANWVQIDMSDEFGDVQQYSEWTDDKVAVILNGMCNPDATTFAAGVYTSTGAGAFDGNVVINANGFFRTVVDDHAIGTGGVPSQGLEGEYLYANGFFPRGYRFLNEGTGIFLSGALDPNGVSFEDSVVELQTNPNPNNESLVFVVKYKLDSTVDKMQIAVFRERKVFEWDDGTTSLTDITNNDLGSDCFHQFKTMKNTTSFDPKPSETDCAKFPDVTKDGTPFTKNINSAIEIVYDFNSALIDRVIDKESYQSHGAWFNIRFPYPVSTFNSISEVVGEIYGGGVNSVAEGVNEPATLDISNMGFTPDGKLGYNQEDSDRLSKLTTFSFALGLKIEGRNPLDGSLFTLDGTAQIRILMGDTNDNVWSFDFELTSTDGAMYPIDTQISAYQVIRGHKPRYAKLNNIIDLINPKDIDNQNIFESRNIKWIVIQHQDQYDDFGRFAPEGNLNDLSNTSLSAALGGIITLTIDDLHFKKTLVVNSGKNSTKNLESEMVHRQDIMLFDQAKEVADSNLQIEQFRHKEFDITTTGSSIFNIKFGDSFYLKNRRLVNDTDKPITSAPTWSAAVNYVPGDIVSIGPVFFECIKKNINEVPPDTEFWVETDFELNTIKLVAKKIEYSISRPAAGKGGVTRTIQGVKRFV